MYDLVIYHRNCADGFTAAWVAKNALPDSTQFVSANYSDKELPDVEGKHVLIVDFSYKHDELIGLYVAGKAKSITILDHHKTSEEDLADFAVGDEGEVTLDDPELFVQGCRALDTMPIRAWFDKSRSGAQLTWSYFYGEGEPLLVQYVGDRDLWRFELPHSREVSAWLFSYPYDFDVWSDLQVKLEDHLSNVRDEGQAILRQHDRNVAQLLSETKRTMVIGGFPVPVANVPYFMASDSGHAMNGDVPFAATYYDNHGGQRVFSLRSHKETGEDVSAIAKQYGGGGHRNAAGFTATAGWEGDEVDGWGDPRE